ncbi:MAG: transposase family protein [Roseateles sp.]
MQAFEALEDPRRRASCAYPLDELLLTALCVVTRGADDWGSVALWAKKSWTGCGGSCPLTAAWPRTTPSAGCSRCSMPSASRPASSPG